MNHQSSKDMFKMVVRYTGLANEKYRRKSPVKGGRFTLADQVYSYNVVPPS